MKKGFQSKCDVHIVFFAENVEGLNVLKLGFCFTVLKSHNNMYFNCFSMDAMYL